MPAKPPARRPAAKKSPATPLPSEASYRPEVQRTLEAIENTYRRISKNKRTAIQFLQRAGIVGKDGRLAPAYR